MCYTENSGFLSISAVQKLLLIAPDLFRDRGKDLSIRKEGEQLENYTKYALKAEAELLDLLNGLDNLFVIACNKCFKEFESLTEPDREAFLKLAEAQGKTVTGHARFDY